MTSTTTPVEGPHRGRRRSLLVGVAVAVAAVVGSLAAAGTGSGQAARTPVGRAGGLTPSIELLPLSTSSDRRIVDSAGRQVLLRGANVNSLGEYWQGDPTEAPTVAVTGTDWDAMAAHGFSVVRLLITWSRIEPVRGQIDQGYLDQVDAAVRAAAAHGIYSVIDMHQDAFSAHTATPLPVDCPPGTGPAKGWDGAPAWAVITDGLSTCTPGERNAAPAVRAAWNHFWDDTDGIRTRFAASWGAVAARFAGRPEVAGYDLLNEPEASRPAAELTPIYEAFLLQVIRSIRAAEAGAPFEHLVFVEPALPAGNLAYGLVIPDPNRAGVDRRNIVASVHNYAESIQQGITIEGLNDVIESITAGMGLPQWGGEYGFWDTSPATLAKVARYAADEDRRRWGGAWWQWRQACGDPHSVGWDGSGWAAPHGAVVHLNTLSCPGDTVGVPTEPFLRVLGRAYPRATPGTLDHLVSDPTTGQLSVEATATAAGGELVVWAPTADDAEHRVTTSGLVGVSQRAVPGGRIITATVAAPGPYSLRIGGDPLPSTTTTVPVPTTAPGGGGLSGSRSG
ncbi:MAG: cellulase family glycosylhydrolase [Acidimicrobiales bacterium]